MNLLTAIKRALAQTAATDAPRYVLRQSPPAGSALALRQFYIIVPQSAVDAVPGCPIVGYARRGVWTAVEQGA